MTPDVAKGMYRRMMAAGESITLRRNVSGGSPIVSQAFPAKIVAYSEDELVAGIDQRSRKVIVLAEDVYKSGFPLPIRKGDKVVSHGRALNIEDIDDDTRRADGGILIAYGFRVMGP